ncbi:MAG TPA: hypothetical protein P5281_07145, partial [Anaerovoracaceae bacterium]|nr:hypothetical protein [Anaerovoracaceae bacterium]
ALVSVKDQAEWQTATDETGVGLTTVYFDLTGLSQLADGLYDLKVTATDQYGNSAEQTGTFTLDNTPPAQPTIAAVSLPGTVRVSYDSASSDVEYFEISYKLQSQDTYTALPGQYISTNPAKSYVFQLGSEIGVPYDYKVTAWDFAGSSSPESAVVTGAALDFRPTMAILPDESKPGQVLELTVSGMMPGEWVALYIDDSGSVWDWEEADEEGTAVFTYTIPSGMVGAHRFKAEGSDSDARVIKTYVIGQYVPVVTVPAEANAGDSITVRAEGFGAVDPGSTGYVQIYLNGTRVYPDIDMSNATESKVEFSGSETYQIPYTISGELEVRGVRSDYTGFGLVAVAPRVATLAVTPAGQSAGEKVTAAAGGFAPAEQVRFYKNGVYVSYRTADQSGAAQQEISL